MKGGGGPLGGFGGEGQLVAVITTNERKVIGDIPIFLAEDRDQMTAWALSMSRITKAMVHELDSEVLLLVRH